MTSLQARTSTCPFWSFSWHLGVREGICSHQQFFEIDRTSVLVLYAELRCPQNLEVAPLSRGVVPFVPDAQLHPFLWHPAVQHQAQVRITRTPPFRLSTESPFLLLPPHIFSLSLTRVDTNIHHIPAQLNHVNFPGCSVCFLTSEHLPMLPLLLTLI